MRHDPQSDDPYLHTDIGKCEECGGKGCEAEELEPEDMPPATKEKCLALAAAMDEVQKMPGGVEFCTDLLIAIAERGGLVLADKTELERLRMALTPFAMLGVQLAGNNHDEATLSQCFFNAPGVSALRARHLKAAVAAMKG